MKKELERILLDLGVKKQDLAKKCGWTPSYFSMKLRKDYFSLSDWEKMSDALGLKLEIRLCGNEYSKVVYERMPEDLSV